MFNRRIDIFVHRDNGPEGPSGKQIMDHIEQIHRDIRWIMNEVKIMRQSTQDLVDAVTQLSTTINSTTTAIDALVAAQGSNDDAAVEEQVNILKGLGPQLQQHLPQVAQAGTGVAQAPADTGASVSTGDTSTSTPAGTSDAPQSSPPASGDVSLSQSAPGAIPRGPGSGA
jgi:uncharacterized protein YukE